MFIQTFKNYHFELHIHVIPKNYNRASSLCLIADFLTSSSKYFMYFKTRTSSHNFQFEIRAISLTNGNEKLKTSLTDFGQVTRLS